MFFKSKYFNKNLIIIAFAGAFSFNVSAASTDLATPFECSDEEVETYLSDEGLIDRAELRHIDNKSYQDAFQTYKMKKKERDGDESCWAMLYDEFNFTEYAEKMNELIDKIEMPSFNTLSTLYDEALKKIQEELSKDICSRLENAAEGLYEEQKEIFEREFYEMKQEFINNSALRYQQDNNFDRWMNKQLEETLDDSEGIITWRNGLEGGLELSDDDRDWEDTLDRLFGKD